MTDGQPENFVTVVSVGSKQDQNEDDDNHANIPGYVTVLTIGDGEKGRKPVKDITEEVIVYRLPGERLGFGLKFEGGTKANEFVERLFIQSCAADSPASHVKSSWGKLTEGDEVLEIDSVPVNTMTRVDCVRSLKDSNVAINLLVRHVFEQQKIDVEETSGADDKRAPPPPPPVPPRKIPRKLIKKEPENFTKPQESMPKKLQTPRYYSPDVSRRDRRFSDGSLGPPDAEVYIDLFLQESTQSLSESDDTGSTISTVIDRFSSFPNTTTSSFSGSLPSTPTAMQRRIDTTNMNICEDEDIKLMSISREENNNVISEENPLCFQDAPLSYGNECTKIIIPGEVEDATAVGEESRQCFKKPPVPPRSKDTLVEKQKDKNLPRLVDFVPKSNGIKETNENSAELIKLFLENERYKSNCDENRNIDVIDNYSDDVDLYTSKWNMSSQLTTIGEVEEESSGGDFNQFNRPNSTPVVIVENADVPTENGKCYEQHHLSKDIPEADGSMATPPSDSRQPPDGDEFPDFVESNQAKNSQNYFKPIAQEAVATTEDFTNFSKYSQNAKDSIPEPTLLHTRSQSLIDMSNLSKEKTSRWNQIVEQRRKGLSKLKGLVIPESTENDVTPVNIPEIKSINTSVLFTVPKIETSVPQVFPTLEAIKSQSPTPLLPPLVSSANNLPKYSPAFKRKSLQVYPTNVANNEHNDITDPSKICETSPSPPRPNRLIDDDLNPPKSLESISSPTRSDCSFDYTKRFNKENEPFPKANYGGKLEDESDNDSAVSSSQSSYNSRFSPPSSPTRSCDMNNFKAKDDDNKNSQNRFLKVASVEAINRKNILASAKCRSGKDLKVGSPVIRRKKETKETEKLPIGNGNETLPENDDFTKESQSDSKVWENSVEPVIKETKPNYAEMKKELKSATKIPESISSTSKLLQRSTPAPLPSRMSEDSNQRRYTSSVLGRKSTPISVKALTQNFENFGPSSSAPSQKVASYKPQVSSRSVKAEILKTETKMLNNNDTKVPAPLVKPKPADLQLSKLDTQKQVDEAGKSSAALETLVLRLETVGSSLGITLAGGTDENKEITVHRIRYGSVAYHDGRLKRGDKVISINGKLTKDLTHAKAADLLKESVKEFTIIIQEGIETVPSTPSSLSSRRSSSLSLLTDVKAPALEVSPKEANTVIAIVKDGSGLGFSIEGGKESPQGDMPLLVKKIFTGGVADKQGDLKIGDQIVKMNDIDFQNLTRIEAWNMMKKIPDGVVNIHIYRKC